MTGLDVCLLLRRLAVRAAAVLGAKPTITSDTRALPHPRLSVSPAPVAKALRATDLRSADTIALHTSSLRGQVRNDLLCSPTDATPVFRRGAWSNPVATGLCTKMDKPPQRADDRGDVTHVTERKGTRTDVCAHRARRCDLPHDDESDERHHHRR